MIANHSAKCAAHWRCVQLELILTLCNDGRAKTQMLINESVDIVDTLDETLDYTQKIAATQSNIEEKESGRVD